MNTSKKNTKKIRYIQKMLTIISKDNWKCLKKAGYIEEMLDISGKNWI